MTTLTTGALTCALLCTTALLSPAHAALQPPPVHPNIDENGVDLTDGAFGFSMSEASIGLGKGELALVRSWSRGGWREAWSGALYQRLEGADTVQHIVFGNRSVKFKKSGAAYVPVSADGSTLSLLNNVFTYRSSDGATYEFRDRWAGMQNGYPCTDYDADRCFLLGKVQQADGRTLTLSWQTVLRCVDISCTSNKVSARLTSVDSSDGYKIAFTYAQANFSGVAPPVAWAQRTSATLSNKASCNPGSAGCATSPWPVVTYSGTTGPANVGEITKPNGEKWAFSYSGMGITGIRRPGSSTDNISVTYVTGRYVSSVVRDGATTNYAYSISGNTATMVVTDAMSKQRVIVSDRALGRPLSVTDELARVTTYQYDVNGRLTRVTAPEGNYSEVAYDARGNVTSVLKVPKAGSGASNILVSAAFDNACGNLLTCNQPNSTTDERGNVTEYSYDPNHGARTDPRSRPSADSIQLHRAGSGFPEFVRGAGGFRGSDLSPLHRLGMSDGGLLRRDRRRGQDGPRLRLGHLAEQPPAARRLGRVRGREPDRHPGLRLRHDRQRAHDRRAAAGGARTSAGFDTTPRGGSSRRCRPIRTAPARSSTG
jgi:YD repeat-containing protein